MSQLLTPLTAVDTFDKRKIRHGRKVFSANIRSRQWANSQAEKFWQTSTLDKVLTALEIPDPQLVINIFGSHALAKNGGSEGHMRAQHRFTGGALLIPHILPRDIGSYLSIPLFVECGVRIQKCQ